METDLNKICIQQKNSNDNLPFVPSESGNVDVELYLPSRNEKDDKNFNFNDPRTWFHLTNEIRRCLIENGPDHRITSNFEELKIQLSDGGFIQFHENWFYKTLKNGDKIFPEQIITYTVFRV